MWILLTVLFAAGCFVLWLALMILLRFMEKKNYTLPNDDELKTCSNEVVERLLTGAWKDKR